MISDKSIGAGLLLFTSLGLIWYTIWTLVTPFFNSEHPIHSLSIFPSREVAVKAPVWILLAGIAAVLARIIKNARYQLQDIT
ncbi:Dolichol phosphate-mannose biosynthesis regulatory [Phaffia rhodozyma]|uniref:Dolichol phosphate-mannose biosynthesis regulatory protein n=1 Tax=Phaffia rhodozyma TaxID=264483 RepID=A0A0F7SQL8_PHARH|nr:Dolichol phosphate-mannose biosynthesis regulatory [Phaffia rhodozyma]